MANTTKDTNNGAEDAAESARSAAVNAMGEAQDRLRSGVGVIAERLPDAVAGAQVAARDTQKALDTMNDQALAAGAGFSVGLAVGLFFAGAHRLFVVLALLPAAAMAATLFGRSEEAATGATKKRSTAG